MELPFAESYKIKMVETIKKSTGKEREEWIKAARYNLFNLKSSQVFIDLLTDSGTGAMSDKQWSELMLGDESYAGASSYYKMKSDIDGVFHISFCIACIIDIVICILYQVLIFFYLPELLKVLNGFIKLFIVKI